VARIESARPFIYGLALEWNDPFAALHAESAIVARVGPDYRVLDWRLLGQGLFDTLATQRVMIGFFLCIIILVSAFNLLASLYLIVIAKTREIAILSTMGARPGAVIRVFVTAGGLSGLIGTAGGLALGLFMCGLLRAYRYPLDVATYQVGELPVHIVPAELILIAGVALAACLLATIPAVRRARRLQVVDGLREA
jgi:lipoprotein-releasing system permease protein